MSPARPTKGEPREAGRALDAEIAEKVMGWTWQAPTAPGFGATRSWFTPDTIYSTNLPHYSTSIAAAWLVVERMRVEHGCILTLEQALMNADEYEDWIATFKGMSGGEWVESGVLCGSQSAPAAICRAALLVMESQP